MKEIDRRAIAEAGIPGIVLMENAAVRTVDAIAADYQALSERQCIVLCGKGNNGGDGFAIARHLYLLGARVQIAFFHDFEALAGDAKTNYEIVKNLNIPMIREMSQFKSALCRCDFMVDALYGIGFHGALRPMEQDIVTLVNRSERRVYAVDIPSGVNADIGAVEGEPLKADKTITFTAYKPAHFLFPAADLCGEVSVQNIGAPPMLVEQEGVKWETIEHEMVKGSLPARRKNSHKGDYGKVFVVAGSSGMSGAAYLAATAAAKSGAGLVTVGTPESINGILEEKTTEVMTLPLPDRNGALDSVAAEEIIRRANAADCLLFGPGLSRSTHIGQILERLLTECTVPLIIDADGIYALANRKELLKNRKYPTIITPHSAEMARLIDASVQDVEADRMGIASSFADTYGATVILKGAHTLVATPEGKGYVNYLTGNPGMATGGSGDVLAGAISALAAAGLAPESAAVCAVYLHGMAGDMAAGGKGMTGMMAGDILEYLPLAFRAVTEEQKKQK